MPRRRRRRAVTGIFLVGGLLLAVAVTATSSASWLSKIAVWPATANIATGAQVAAGPAGMADSTAREASAPGPRAAAEPPAAGVEPQSAPEAEAPAESRAATRSAVPLRRPAVMNYIVRSGETMSELADSYDTTVEKLLEYNQGLEAARLRAGEIIKVPDKAAERGELRPHYVWPADGTITTPFGERGSSWLGGYHMGLDIGGFMGDIVWSADDGVIVDTGTDGMGRGYGTYVLIYHYNGWFTLYGHLSKVYRAAGYTASKGEPIGEVGMTGFADGPHLHFEVWHASEKLDPIQFLP